MSGAPVVQPGWCPGCDPSNCEGCGPTPRLLSKELEAMGPAAWDTGSRLVRSLDELQPTELPPMAPKATPLYRSPAPVAPVGWVLAPVRPTTEMIAAADEVEDLYRRGTPDTWGSVYRAMLAAAPFAPAPVAQPLTDEQIVAAARALNKMSAEACNVDEGDSWELYGNSYIADAAVILKAALINTTGAQK